MSIFFKTEAFTHDIPTKKYNLGIHLKAGVLYIPGNFEAFVHGLQQRNIIWAFTGSQAFTV